MGADVLGVLVGRASGKPFESFLQERLFGPMRMKDTAFSVPASKMDRFVDSCWTDLAKGRGRALRQDRDRAVEQAPGLPVRSGRPGLHGRRLGGLCDNAHAGRNPQRQAHPERGLGRGDDQRPSHLGTEGGLGLRAGLLRPLLMGLLHVGCHRRRPAEVAGHLRLGRRDGDHLVQRPVARAEGCHDDPEGAAVPLPPPVYLEFWKSAYSAAR
jgi:CubicO group peptidase (beta-lactamase class C family)